MSIPIPTNDRERIAHLHRLFPDFATTHADQPLQGLVELAATLCGAPIALVSLVGEEQQHFRARTGLEADHTDRDVSFCTWAIMDDDPLVVPDATVDERFRANPLVTGEPHISFYAGVPLITSDRRYRLGTICVIDHEPRTLEAEQLRALERLADSVVDIVEQRHEVRSSMLRAEGMLDSIADCVVAVDTEAIVTYANPAACALLGRDPTGLPARTAVDLVLDGAPLDEHPLIAALEHRRAASIPAGTSLTTLDGSNLEVDDLAAPIYDSHAELSGAVMVFRNVSHQREVARQLEWQGTHDSLTGIHNRAYFETELAELLGASSDEACLIYLDLDRFKGVNDELGHPAGDHLLVQVAAAIAAGVRSNDTVARIGGDEFGVLLRSCDLTSARRIAEGLLAAFRTLRGAFSDQRANIDASIGIVALDDPDLTVEEVLHRADSACYAAKHAGGGRVQTFDPTLSEIESWNGSIRWMNVLQTAIRDDHLRLYGQRIEPLIDEKLPSVEVLVRLDHDGEIVRPGAFIAAAERFRLARALDEWVVTETLRTLDRVDVAGRIAQVHINLSGQTIGDPVMAERLGALIRASSIPGELLCFEITESNAVAELWAATDFISQLTSLGCTFALDDFGRGFSSFEYLRRFDVTTVKIDGSFVSGVADDEISRGMLSAIASISRLLGKRTIAEWVDGEATIAILRELGVDAMQGNYLAEPVPLDEVLTF